MKKYIVYAHDVKNTDVTFETYCEGMNEEDVKARYTEYLKEFDIIRVIDKVTEKQ